MTDDDEILIYAFRYCLGRATYAVSDCCRWLRERWLLLDPKARAVILNDLNSVIVRDDIYRSANNNEPSLALGHEMDSRQWRDLYRWMLNEGS